MVEWLRHWSAKLGTLVRFQLGLQKKNIFMNIGELILKILVPIIIISLIIMYIYIIKYIKEILKPDDLKVSSKLQGRKLTY